MSRSLRVTAGMIGALTLGLVRASAAGPEPQSPASSLRVVVVAGEGAINILEQKSAVAPVVEVRDRNDQPIAGALVTFTVRRGGAAFNGARTISVTTDAAGRAAASGFSAGSSGGVQIQAVARFQGRTAAATIVQTNVLTAAQAATATTTGTAGGAGGLSATTVGIVSGAAVAGAVLSKAVLFPDGIPGRFVSPFNFVATETRQNTSPPSFCTASLAVAGTVVIDDSHLEIDWLETPTTSNCASLGSPKDGGANNDVTGPPESLTYDRTVTFQSNGGTGTIVVHFEGALNDAADAIAGNLTISRSFTAGTYSESYPAVSVAVTLAKE